MFQLYFSPTPTTPLKYMLLEHYEILPCEPMHSLGGHIKNLYEELKYHINPIEKQVLTTTITASFSGKEAKRVADYRLGLVDICISVKNKINERIYNICLSLCEMQQILYQLESERSPKLIFRYHNIKFLHALQLNEVAKNIKKLTIRKLFGQYYHALIHHAPDQLRIISFG